MKILFICRKYSAIHVEAWNHAGSPTIVKLLETLENDGHKIKVLFLSKNHDDNMLSTTITTNYDTFKNSLFCFIPYKGIEIKSSFLSSLSNSLLQFISIFNLFYEEKYDIYYVDRCHLFYAAILSLLKKKVVWRCLGVNPFIQAKYDQSVIVRLLYYHFCRFLLYTPIKLFIVTNDGSAWFKLFTTKKIRRKTKILSNGVDRNIINDSESINIRGKFNISQDTPILLYVSKLNELKGAWEFTQALKGLHEKNQSFFSILIGYGPLKSRIESYAKDNNLSDKIVCLGRVQHKTIFSYLKNIDIYVSMNKAGSMGNATLEAMAAGRCVVTLGMDKIKQIDKTTEEQIPADVVIRVDRENMIEDLSRKLSFLIEKPDMIVEYSRRMKEFSKSFLWSWSERIRYEVEMLDKLAKGKQI
jgi:glycosyltransferase involved in cell wall biosynthesis